MVKGDFSAFITHLEPGFIHSAKVGFLIQIFTGGTVLDNHFSLFSPVPNVAAQATPITVIFPIQRLPPFCLFLLE